MRIVRPRIRKSTSFLALSTYRGLDILRLLLYEFLEILIHGLFWGGRLYRDATVEDRRDSNGNLARERFFRLYSIAFAVLEVGVERPCPGGKPIIQRTTSNISPQHKRSSL